ncbi:hypothetical protein BST61_g5202 [Cercospora zeina]
MGVASREGVPDGARLHLPKAGKEERRCSRGPGRLVETLRLQARDAAQGFQLPLLMQSHTADRNLFRQHSSRLSWVTGTTQLHLYHAPRPLRAISSHTVSMILRTNSDDFNMGRGAYDTTGAPKPTPKPPPKQR